MSNQSFEDALSSVIGNEELMSKISSVVKQNNNDMEKSLSDVISLISESTKSESDDTEASDTKTASTDLNEKGGIEGILKGFDGLSKNRALLKALRPYLSEKRCQMIDSLLKIEQVAEIMKIAR